MGRREQSFPDKRRSMCVPPGIRFGEAQMEKTSDAARKREHEIKYSSSYSQ